MLFTIIKVQAHVIYSHQSTSYFTMIKVQAHVIYVHQSAKLRVALV